MRYLEVRCCCTPTRLYGYLPASENTIAAGRRMKFALRDQFKGNTCYSLPIETFVDDNHMGRPAVKFEGGDMSPQEKLELLRWLPGFREANDPPPEELVPAKPW